MSKYPTYIRPFWLPSSHLETILPALLRKAPSVKYNRERIITPDGDFLDLDWIKIQSSRLTIVCHGMEGSSDRPYMKGMADALIKSGSDVLTWNYRGCSGEMNRKPIFYHSGATYDLETVINHVKTNSTYDFINLVGFSLGGNLILKYLGEKGSEVVGFFNKAMAISVPLDLATCCEVISMPSRFVYSKRFLNTLTEKVKLKEQLIPGSMPMADLKKIKDLRSFDDFITASLHGFKNAEDYYRQSSSIYFLPEIKIKTYIVNALNDPFLSELSFPKKESIQNPKIETIFTLHGGHVGFTLESFNSSTWVERLASKLLLND